MAITLDGTNGITSSGVITAPDGSASAPAITNDGDTNTGIYFPSADSVAITTGGTAAVTVDSGQRTKFPTTIGIGGATPSTSGSGISFPATQSASTDANTLDDYEEGTWTPTVVGSTSAGTGTYSIQGGYYTKIGRQVSLTAYIYLTAHTGTGNTLIGGLPFTTTSASNSHSAGAIGYLHSLTLTANNYAMLLSQPNKTTFDLYQYPVGGGSPNAVAMDVAFEIVFQITYFV